MADKSTLTISIVTPDGEVYNHKNVDMAIFNTKSGQMGIMPNHVPVVASLEVNMVRIDYGHHEDKVAVNGGFVEFSNNVATIVANSAEKQSDIDVKRATRAKARARAMIRQSEQNHDKVALQRSQLALKRAINRIQTAKN